MEEETPVHWYMKLESQGFSLIPTAERYPEYDRKFHYLGEITRSAASREAYSRWHGTTVTLEGTERTVGGTK